MRVLFLDVDGVINKQSDFTPETGTYALNRGMCDMLADWLEKNDVSVVLSSTWRKHDDHVLYLREFAPRITNRFLDDYRTPDLWHELPEDAYRGFIRQYLGRGQEIKIWIERQAFRIDQYFILDDDGDFSPEQRKSFVQTSYHTGLCKKHIKRLDKLIDNVFHS